MNQRRLIFYGVFGAFHLIAFIFTLVMENSATMLLNLIGYIGWFKYITFFGVVMVVTDFVWAWLENRTAKRLEDSARLENNTLKAKVYDLQEAGKPKPEMSSVKPATK